MFATAAISSSRKAPFLGYYRSLTLDQPASDLSDFPVLFSGTYTYLKTIANGGNVNNANGYDIVFYSDAALTTKLNFERVYWDATTGTVEFWVKVPSLTSASALVIYLAYGNTSITTDQQNAAGTWNSSFKAVYHFKDGTTLSLLDSTTINNGTNNNATADASGKIDGAVAMSGSSQYVNIGTDASLGITGSISLSAWVKITDFVGYNGFVGKTGSGTNNNIPAPYDFFFSPVTGKPNFLKGSGGGQGLTTNYNTFAGTSAPSTGIWQHIAVTMSGSNNGTVTHYLNGSTNGSGNLSFSDASADAGQNALVGTRGDFFTMLKGSVDEMRIYSGVLTTDWISAEYSNQNDPANFYIIGSETPV